MSGPVKIIDERGVYPSALDQAAAEQARAQATHPWATPEARAERAAKIAACDHDYQREPYSGSILVYECPKCGDSYERDVS